MIIGQGWKSVQHNILVVSWGCGRSPIVETVSWSLQFIIRTDKTALWLLLNVTETTGNLAKWRLRQSEIIFEPVHGCSITHQTTDELSCLSMTEMKESPLEDYIPVLMIMKALPEGGQTDMAAKVWHRLYSSDGMTSQGLACQSFDKCQKGLTTKDCIRENNGWLRKKWLLFSSSYQYCRLPHFFCSKNRNGVPITQAQVDGSLQKAITTSFCPPVLYRASPC